MFESVCPRCGVDLKAGFTADRKVCSDCPRCGGRLVTLPVLREGLGQKGTATLARAAREEQAIGCRCPACGEAMALLKVPVAGHDVEIDVCPKCLSVWCDRGEFDELVPKLERKAGPKTFKEVMAAASPEARERYAQVALEQLPVDVDAGLSSDDVLMDVARLVMGAPSLWRKVAPVNPILSFLLAAALPIAHACFYYSLRGTDVAFHSSRRFWVAGKDVVQAVGLSTRPSLASLFAFPFVQDDGRSAIILALLLAPLMAIVERKAGVRQFLFLLVLLWATTVGVYMLSAAPDRCLIGCVPIGLGFATFAAMAYAEVKIVWGKPVTVGFLAFTALLCLVFIQMVAVLSTWRTGAPLAFGALPCLASAVVGGMLGWRRRSRQPMD